MNRDQRRLYETCIRLGNDRASEFYFQGTPRTGASHRVAYWRGRAGEQQPVYIDRASLTYAAYRAGQDERKRDAAKGNAMPAWMMRGSYRYPPENWKP